MALTTYIVNSMRVYPPQGKTADNNPDRVLTVAGEFYASELDEKGNLVPKGEQLSFVSKSFTREQVLAEGFRADKVNGILTVNAGERGRTAYDGIEQDEIDALLDSIRNSEDEDEVEVDPTA